MPLHGSHCIGCVSTQIWEPQSAYPYRITTFPSCRGVGWWGRGGRKASAPCHSTPRATACTRYDACTPLNAIAATAFPQRPTADTPYIPGLLDPCTNSKVRVCGLHAGNRSGAHE